MNVFGLIGNPVGHSLSPPMHEAAYDALEMDARYVTFEPAKAALGSALRGAQALGIGGLNVTIPFKEAVFDFVDPNPLAKRIGAVNTIDFSTDPPNGFNTDAAGVIRALKRHEVRIEGQTTVVVGAGGAGRAMAFALADEWARVRIANRTLERAERLAAELEGATAHRLDDVPDLLADTDLLLNATSVGMEEDRSPVPTGALHADLVVMDAVYQPIDTRLLQDAAEAGAKTIDGAWMLLYQGVEAFEHWTNRSAPVGVMNQALRERL